MKKRILSMALACVMLLSALPAWFVAAGAEEAETVFTSSFWEEAQDGKITYSTEDDTVSYNGDWKTVILAAQSYAPILLDRLNPRYGEEGYGYWAVTPTAYSGISTYHWAQFSWGSLPGSGLLELTSYEIGISNGQGITAYLYTVKEEGEFDIAVEIDHFTAPVDEDHPYYMCVMVNEKMVWPLYGGAYAYGSDPYVIFEGDDNWYLVTNETTQEDLNAALSGLAARVTKGDVVEVCYRCAPGKTDKKLKQLTAAAMPKITGKTATGRAAQYLVMRENGATKQVIPGVDGKATLPAYTGEALFRGWDVTGDGVPDYQVGATVNLTAFDADIVYADAVTVGSTTFANHKPTLDANNNPTFSGNWDIGTYDTNQDMFLSFSATADSYGIITAGEGVWTGHGGGFYTGSGMIAFSGCTETGGYMNEIRYTAEYSGTVALDLDRLVLRRQDARAPGYAAYNMAVYKNGEKVWPATENMHLFTNEETIQDVNFSYDALDQAKAAGFPMSIEVETGDVISIRTQQADANCWMAYIHPTVTYTALKETPLAANAALDIGTDLTLQFYVDVINPREGAEVGLEYWTTEPTESMLMKGGTALEGVYDGASGYYKFAYAGLSAKQMAKKVYVRPFSYVGDDVVYGDVASFSIRQYAEKAMGQSKKLDDVLIALLTYGSNVQSAFSYMPDDLAGENLSDEQRPALNSVPLNDVYAQGEGETPITAVSLLLDNQLGFKFMVNNVEGATSYVLQFADNADFTDAREVTMETTKEGLEQKAVVRLALSELGKTYYVRAVVDGAPGATLTYSLESYAYRVGNTVESEGMYQSIMALANLSQKVDAYLAG